MEINKTHNEKCRQYYRKNRSKILLQKKIYNSKKEIKEKNKKRIRKYYLDNKDKIKEQSKKYYNDNKEHCCKRNSIYAKEYHKLEKYKLSQKKYRKKNRIRILKYINNWRKEEFKNNPISKLAHNMRVRINIALRKHGNKKLKSVKYLECSISQLKIHLEKQFSKGMTWKNYGKWHVDHIIPLSSSSNIKTFYKLCNFNNLQPLWAIDNLRKNKYYDRD